MAIPAKQRGRQYFFLKNLFAHFCGARKTILTMCKRFLMMLKSLGGDRCGVSLIGAQAQNGNYLGNLVPGTSEAKTSTVPDTGMAHFIMVAASWGAQNIILGGARGPSADKSRPVPPIAATTSANRP